MRATEVTPHGSVLLVEDDAPIGGRVRDALEIAGYRVTWVRTGASALIEAQIRPPETVLLDLGLPDCDGIGVARTLRSRHPSVAADHVDRTR